MATPPPGHFVLITREKGEEHSVPQPADTICPRTLPSTQFSSFAACNKTKHLRNQLIRRATKQLAGYKHKVNPSERLSPNLRVNNTVQLHSISMPSYEWPSTCISSDRFDSCSHYFATDESAAYLRSWMECGDEVLALDKRKDYYETTTKGEGSRRRPF
jgi:hypothetical protein